MKGEFAYIASNLSTISNILDNLWAQKVHTQCIANEFMLNFSLYNPLLKYILLQR